MDSEEVSGSTGEVIAVPDLSGSDGGAVVAVLVQGSGLGGSDSSSSATTSGASGIFSGGSLSGASVTVPDVNEGEVSALVEAPAVGASQSAVAVTSSDAGLTDAAAQVVTDAAPLMTAAPVEATGAASGLAGQTSRGGPGAPEANPLDWTAAYVRHEVGNGEDASEAAGKTGAAHSGEPGSESLNALNVEVTTDSSSVTSPAVPVAAQSDVSSATPPEANTSTGLPSSAVMHFISAGHGPIADQSPSAPAVPNPLGDLLFAIFRQVRNTYFNSSPTATPRQDGSSLGGVATGTVGGSDPDGDPLTYTVVEGPTRGQLTLNTDGSYVYTASEGLAAAGGSDSFTVVVAEANSDSHIHGFGGLVALALSAFFPGAGINDGSRIETTVTVAIEQVTLASEVKTRMAGAGVPVDDLATAAANNETGMVFGQVNNIEATSTSAASLAATTSTSSGDDVPYVSTNAVNTPRARIALSAALPPNSAPTVVDDGPFTVSQGQSLTLTHEQLVGNDTDPDLAYGDALAVNWVWAPTGAVVHNDAAAKTVTYTPAPDHLGERWFAYRAKDSAGTTSADYARVTVEVSPNSAPT
ncbi:MAG: cadherin-like domain-containing protein, partial [Actinomycetia bacterium]|nr:cadherin-like domain-containing protein [Actinomycetes bacterium]